MTDFEWSVIEPLLSNKSRGVPRVDDRKVLNGIYWRLRTGSPWAYMLEAIGSSQALWADAAYDSDALRRQVKAQGGWLCAKPVSYRREKPPFSRWPYRFRNVIERFFNRIKYCRAIATRYEKHDENYLALIKLAAIRLWIGHNGSSGNLWSLP
ncbi:transposase [Nitratireductor aquimarinus]|nr:MULTISPECIES: transposase [Nitratireductor]MBN8244538.1 transposase [Nitratireductor aquimarinus]MBY6132926.1 transposase [Nitratireductor aquimarinus]MCA1301770.1 transposase [Nitratireductor aquimarinus]